MLKRMPRTIAAEQSLKSGLFKLRDIAACAYGNGKWIQYRDAAGTCQLTMSMGEIVKNASLEDVEASKALAVLSTGTLPENGVKSNGDSAGISVGKSGEPRLHGSGCKRSYALLEYAVKYLPAIAKENNGELLGSVLPYMTLIKPLNKRARELGNERAAATMEYALTTLLLMLPKPTVQMDTVYMNA